MALIIKDQELRAAQITEGELRVEIAILLYQQERLSLGKASKFAGLNRILFQQELGKRGVPVNYDIEALEEDLKTLGLDKF
jgi:predicted HTH domain antitoxin